MMLVFTTLTLAGLTDDWIMGRITDGISWTRIGVHYALSVVIGFMLSYR